VDALTISLLIALLVGIAMDLVILTNPVMRAKWGADLAYGLLALLLGVIAIFDERTRLFGYIGFAFAVGIGGQLFVKWRKTKSQ
jgi:hypothetical protein